MQTAFRAQLKLLFPALLLASGCIGEIGSSTTLPSTGAPPSSSPPSGAASGGTPPARANGPGPSTPSGPASRCGTTALPRTVTRLPGRRVGKAMRDLLRLSDAPVLTSGGGSLDTLLPGDAPLLATAQAYEYAEVARQAASQANVTVLAGCPAGTAEAACARRFIESFASRAFRRPVRQEETTRLMAVFDLGRTGGTWEGALRLVIETVLQSPSFLYRTAMGAPGTSGAYDLSAYELAAELAFFFLDSVPDDGLWQAASSGTLTTAEGLDREITRLLANDRVRANLTQVMATWLGGNRILTKSKDARLFPDFAGARASLARSRDLFVEDLLWKRPGTLDQLLTGRSAWVDPTAAKFLGVKHPGGNGFAEVTMPEGRWAGILTHPALLGSLATENDSDAIHRALFVFGQLLCQPTVPPPPGAVEAASDATKGLTNERQRAEYRASQALCGGCHAQFDAFGLLFENFDAAGRYQTVRDGAPVNARASVAVPASLAGAYEHIFALGDRLVQSPELSACAAQQMLGYALGRPLLSQQEVCLAEEIGQRFSAGGRKLSDLFRAVALSEAFRARKEVSP